METQTKIRNVRRLIWLGGLAAFITVAIAVGGSWLLYHQTTRLLTENLRERLLSVSITQASNISASDLAALQEEADWQKPEWGHIVNAMHKAKYGNDDIVFMYIFRKTAEDPTQMEFVADADSIDPYANINGDPSRYVDVNRDGIVEPDGPDKLQWPGQPYPEAVDIPEAFEAYNGPLTAAELYTDAYGTVLTGYAPIRDDAGNTVGVLATDIKADDFFTVTRQTLIPFLGFIAFLILIILMLTFVLIRTWKKQVEAEVRQHERLQALTNELAISNEKLKQLDQLKSEFLSFAAHDLKSPISLVKQFASLIYDGTYKDPAQIHETVLKIKNTADRAVNMVNTFLDLRRIEEGRMEYNFEKKNLVEFVGGITSDFAALAKQQKNIDVSIDFSSKEIFATIDTTTFRQVFQNFLDNALKYTERGWIKVKMQEEQKSVLITISDSGLGMDKDLVPILFEQFRRDPSVAKKIQGTGLGLFIAKQIVLTHHGDTWAESEGKGKGSTFYIRIPKV